MMDRTRQTTLPNSVHPAEKLCGYVPLLPDSGQLAVAGAPPPDILVSCVAHEINNPNNCILHNAQLVAQIWEDTVQVLDEYYQEHGDFSLGGLELPFAEVRTIMPRLIAGIADGSCRIRNIIDSFKAYARTGSDGPGVLFSINSVILSALSLLREQISRCTDEIALNLQDHLPPLRGSVQRMEQVVVNLLTNALESLPSRQAGIVLSTSLSAETGDLILTIRDEGCGMDQDTLEQITEPFFSTRKDSGGTGLGLYITRMIVHEHGGQLLFSSEPGVGTLATVILPRERD